MTLARGMRASHADAASQRAGSRAYVVWGALIWVLGLTPAALALTSSRTFGLSYQESVTSFSANQGGLASSAYTLVTALMLGLGGISLLLGLISQRARLPKAGLILWLGAMAFALGPLLSSRFGSHPDLSLTLLGLPVVFTAVYLLPPVSLDWFVNQVKRILLFYAYGSLLAALVAPRWAVEYPYAMGVIPGFDVRLHGLVSHANSLAPLLLTYLVLSWFSPSKTRWDYLHQVVVLLALILTQSKTVWVLFVLAYLIRLAYAAWRLPPLQRYSVLSLLGATFVGGVVYLAAGPAWLDSVEVMLSGEQFTTLTGRTLIWQVTLNLWEQNPWFGYGPELWNLRMGLAYAPVIGSVVPHAHSQVYQSLGESGIVGMTGLFLYVVALLVYGARCARVTGGVALILVSVLLLRGITEPPLRGSPGDSNFYIHYLIFALLILASKKIKSDPRTWRSGRYGGTNSLNGAPVRHRDKQGIAILSSQRRGSHQAQPGSTVSKRRAKDE